MRRQTPLLPVGLAFLGGAVAAQAQAEVFTVWVQRNGDGPQPFFFGYGRTMEIAEALAFRSCGANCTILKSGRGCVSITMAGQEFFPRGCEVERSPETQAKDSEV